MQNPKHAIHLFYGSDDFSMREVLRWEKDALLGMNPNADIADFDFADTASRADLEQKIRSALRTGSLFSSDKLTVVRDFWSSQRKSSAGESVAAAAETSTEKKKISFEDFLLDYLARMDRADRIFFLESRSLDKRSRAYKFFEKLAAEGKVENREFAMPLGFKFNLWLEERIKQQGGKISKSDLDLLAMLLGRGMEQKERGGELVAAYDLYQAASEIDKLLAYAAAGEIRREDILLLVSASSDLNIFNLIESIARRDKSRALALLSGQIRAGFNENYILTMLVYHFRGLIAVKSLLGEGLDKSEIARRTRLHPMVVEKNINYARHLSEEHLVTIYEKLYGADVSIKTGRMEPELALDLLVAAV